MLRRMNDSFVWWLILVGLAIGVVVSWLLIVRIPRGEADISAAERQEEAVWIGDIIERHGGVAPLTLVDEVLELHQAYLRSPGAVEQIEEMPTASTVAADPPQPQPGSGSGPAPPTTPGGPPPR